MESVRVAGNAGDEVAFHQKPSIYKCLLTATCCSPNIDSFVKSQKSSVFVIPANAGIQEIRVFMDPRFRGGDGFGNFLRDHQYLFGSRLFETFIAEMPSHSRNIGKSIW